MTLQQVKRALGRPAAVVRRDEPAFGGGYVELQWAYSTWTVGFRHDRGARRVVRVATTVDGQRTSTGIGPGSTARDVLSAYPRATCTFRALQEPWPGTWLVAYGPGRSMTAFLLFGRRDYGDVRPRRFVIEVVVQAGWYAPETGGSCGPDWRREFRRS